MKLLNKLCRLCLLKNDLIQYTSIFQRDSVDSIDIIKKIKFVMPSLKFPDINMEQFVCQNCLISLRQFCIFKTACEKNASIFMGLVRQVQSEVQKPQMPEKSLKIVPLNKLRALEPTPSISPASTATESIITPKIVAVYSLQCNSSSENPVTDFSDDTIKIEDDDVEFIPQVPLNTLKRSSTEAEKASPQAKIIKLTETQNKNKPNASENSVTNTPIDNNMLADDFEVLIPLEPIVMKRIPTQHNITPPLPNFEVSTDTDDCDMPEIFKTEIWKAIDSRLSTTSRQLQKIIGDKFRIWPCTIQIEKVIKNLHYNINREPQATQIRNGQAVMAARLQYAKEYAKYNEDKIIFVHEMGVRLAIRKKISLNYVYVKEFRVAAAMSRKDLVYFSLTEQQYNIEDYGNWITDLLPILKWKNKDNSIIVTENCPSHKIESKIISDGHRLLFLPPYSPFLNPLENIFSKWQRDIKALDCLVLETLIANMKQFNIVINLTDCEIVYDKMKNCLSRCMKQMSF